MWPAGCKDRKSTRLNSSHGYISYAVFCLKKKIEKLFVVAEIDILSVKYIEQVRIYVPFKTEVSEDINRCLMAFALLVGHVIGCQRLDTSTDVRLSAARTGVHSI